MRGLPRGLLFVAVTCFGCEPADPIPGPTDAGPAPMVDGTPMPEDQGPTSDMAVDAEDAAVSSDGTLPDGAPDSTIDSGPPQTMCGEMLCSADQVCVDVCGLGEECAGTAYGVSCLDSCGCNVGLECNDLSLRCTPCVSRNLCDGQECLKGPGVCAPQVTIGGLVDLIRVFLACADQLDTELPTGCADLDTTMGLVADGVSIDSLEPVARDQACAGLDILGDDENQAFQTLVGCEGSSRLVWNTAVPVRAMPEDHRCVYTLPARLSPTGSPVVVLDDCQTPPDFTD